MKEFLKLTGIVWIPFTLGFLFRNKSYTSITLISIVGFFIGLILLFNTKWIQGEQKTLDEFA